MIKVLTIFNNGMETWRGTMDKFIPMYLDNMSNDVDMSTWFYNYRGSTLSNLEMQLLILMGIIKVVTDGDN